MNARELTPEEESEIDRLLAEDRDRLDSELDMPALLKRIKQAVLRRIRSETAKEPVNYQLPES